MESEALLKDQLSLFSGELAPMAGGKIGGQEELANPSADQAQCGQTDGRRHAADLTIAAFVEFQFQPCGGNVLAKADRRLTWRIVQGGCFGASGESFASLDNDAFGQLS